MELTPVAPRRNYNNRAFWYGVIGARLGEYGYRFIESSIRRYTDGHIENFANNLIAAAQQGAVRVAEVYRQFFGEDPERLPLESSIGMPRRHRWGEATEPPTSYTKEALIGRIRNFRKTVEDFKRSNPRKLKDIADREKELKRWEDYYKDQFGTDTPPPSVAEAEQRGAVRPLTPEAEERRVEPRLEEEQLEQDLDELPEDEIVNAWGDDWEFDSDIFEHVDEELAPVEAVAPDMAYQQKAGIGGGSNEGAMQQVCGRIGKNPPIRSPDGSSVIFSGSRQMYTWAYNYSEQKNPFAASVDLSYNSIGDQLVKVLGHTVPWDMISFYCTPAEWESLLWKTHRIEIEEVEVRITPIDKSVFFTTGSTQTTAVSTEHAAYIFKIDRFPKNAILLKAQPKTGVQAIDWTEEANLQTTNYLSLRNRLWGPMERAKTGHSCLDGIKRELENLQCMLLDDPSKSTDFGSFLLGEYQSVYPLVEKMGKPFITKKFKPVCGVVSDPSCKVVMNQFSEEITSADPYKQSIFLEDMLHESAIFCTKPNVGCQLGYDKGTGGNLGTSDGSNNNLHGGPSAAYLVNDALGSYPNPSVNSNQIVVGGTVVNAYTTVGNPQNKSYVSGQPTTAQGAPSAGECCFLTSCNYDASNKGYLWSKGYVANKLSLLTAPTPTGMHIFGNQGGLQGSLAKGTKVPALTTTTFTDWKQTISLDKDVNVNYGDTNTSYLQSWHAKIEKGNSFIQMGPDRDNFPRVVPEQPTFAFGMKPVLATDPNGGTTDYLKANVNWKIEYRMKIKQTYVPPELRFVERRCAKKTDDTRTGPFILPAVPDYSSDIRPYGLNISVKATGKYLDDTTSKSISYDISEQNPLQRDLTIDGKVYGSIRSGFVLPPDAPDAFNNSIQSKITNTPSVLSEIVLS